MANFRDREHSYNDNLGNIISGFCMGVAKADVIMSDAYTDNISELAALPNAEFVTEASLIGLPEKLQVRTSVPMIGLASLKPLQIQEAILELDMTVSAHEESKDTLKIDAGVEGKVSFGGIGPIGGGSVKIKASVSKGKEHARSSDYRSQTHVRVKLGLGEIPECLALLYEGNAHIMNEVMEINKVIVGRYAEQLLESAQAEEPPPPIEPSNANAEQPAA